MDHLGTRIMAVSVVNTAIGLIQWLVRRQIPTLGKGGQMGIYAILVPLGFGLFGWDLPYWFTTLFVVGGLAELLYSVKKQLGAVSHNQTEQALRVGGVRHGQPENEPGGHPQGGRG